MQNAIYFHSWDKYSRLFFTNVTSSNCQVKYEFEFHSNANVPENKGEFFREIRSTRSTLWYVMRTFLTSFFMPLWAKNKGKTMQLKYEQQQFCLKPHTLSIAHWGKTSIFAPKFHFYSHAFHILNFGAKIEKGSKIWIFGRKSMFKKID